MNLRDVKVPVELVSIANILRNAARYVERYGWCHSDTYEGIADVNGPIGLPVVNNPLEGWPPVDAVGAVGVVVHGYVFPNPYEPGLPRYELFAVVYRVLGDHLVQADVGYFIEHPGAPIHRWNDQPGMTARRVIDALNGAADWHEDNPR